MLGTTMHINYNGETHVFAYQEDYQGGWWICHALCVRLDLVDLGSVLRWRASRVPDISEGEATPVAALKAAGVLA